MEQKTFTKASCIYNMHTGEKIFLQLLHLNVCVSFFDSDRLKNLKSTSLVLQFGFSFSPRGVQRQPQEVFYKKQCP